MSLEEKIVKLVNTGNSLLTIPVVSDDDSDLFIVGLDKYLSQLDVIQPLLKDEAKTVSEGLAKELLDVHQKVLEKAEKEKESVLIKMGQINQRANMLKTYLNQFPGRISITGKREG
jgi:hypothetical protein